MVKLSQIAFIVATGLFVSAEAGKANTLSNKSGKTNSLSKPGKTNSYSDDFDTKCENMQQKTLKHSSRLVQLEKKNKQLKLTNPDKHCCLKDEMTCEQKETYAYYEGGISALEEALLTAVDLAPDGPFETDEMFGLSALLSNTELRLSEYQSALVRIQEGLDENCPCGKAQKAYLELEAQELSIILDIIHNMDNGNGAFAKNYVADYKQLTESAEASAIDENYKTTCAIGYI